MLSLMETPVMGGRLRPSLVKPHKAAPWTLGVETGSAVDQVEFKLYPLLESNSVNNQSRAGCWSTGMCISRSLVCNGDQDCEEDREDENSCPQDTHNVCPDHAPPPNVESTGFG